MQNPLITIVIPVYRVPEVMLRRYLDSIVAQDCGDFEAIAIDDGSSDVCGEICDEYAGKYDNFRVLHQQNGGLAVVRNVGIDNAAGR